MPPHSFAMIQPALRHLLALPLCIALAPASGRAAVQEPLVPGLRWIHQAPAALPWIPTDVSFAGAADFVLASAAGASPRLVLLDAANEPWPAARVVLTEPSVASGGLVLAGCERAERAFALLQPQTSDPHLRLNEVRALDPTRGFAPLWSHDMGVVTIGSARLEVDTGGQTVLAAAWSHAEGTIQLDWLDGASGTLRARTIVAGVGVGDLTLSADGERAALLSGDRLRVFDADGALLHVQVLQAPAQSIDLDADGDTLVLGGKQQLAVLREEAHGYELCASLYPGSSDWYALVAAVAPGGDAVAIGWWDSVRGDAVRYELWELATLTRSHAIEQGGSSPATGGGGVQHLPSAVVFSSDGRRAAFGGWGSAAGEPQVLLVDRDLAEPLLAIDLPGSVRGLALDAHGQRLAIAHGDTHAGTAGTTGAVRLYSTGEAELELLAAPRAGGALRLAARHPGQGFVFFLVGRRAEPTPLGGLGTLFLERSSLAVYARVAAASGRADLDLALPADPTLVGTRLAVQAAFRSGAGLSLGETVLEPLILD